MILGGSRNVRTLDPGLRNLPLFNKSSRIKSEHKGELKKEMSASDQSSETKSPVLKKKEEILKNENKFLSKVIKLVKKKKK